MVFIQHCFHLEQHCFHLDRQFSCSSNISNWLSRIPIQYSLFIQNSCSSWLSCTLSNLLMPYCCPYNHWYSIVVTNLCLTTIVTISHHYTNIVPLNMWRHHFNRTDTPSSSQTTTITLLLLHQIRDTAVFDFPPKLHHWPPIYNAASHWYKPPSVNCHHLTSLLLLIPQFFPYTHWY